MKHISDSEIFSAKFSYDGSFVAVASNIGTLKILNSWNGSLEHEIVVDNMTLPFSAISWNPIAKKDLKRIGFKAVSSDGRIVDWRPRNKN